MAFVTIWKSAESRRRQVSLGKTNQCPVLKPPSSGMSTTFLLASIAAISLFFSEIEGVQGDAHSAENIVFQQPIEGIVVGVPNDDGLDKRGSGFMPMRGRRTPLTPDHESFEDDKRGAFMPSRGKKESFYYYPEGVSGPTDPKRSSAFLPMRGRRPEGLNGGPKSRYPGQFFDVDGEDALGYKRSAFMPMRGRKNSPIIASSDKRLQGSFLPMRGRKWEPESTSLYGESGDSNKRASAFTAMRGRKKAFFGNVGSKRVNAFMAMRGKKDSVEDEEMMPKDRDDLLEEDILVRPSLHDEEASGAGGQEDKRAGSFFGSRGKRYAKPATSNSQ